MKIMVTITGLGRSSVVNYGRWNTNYVALLLCGHAASFGKRIPKVGTKTRCVWCERKVESGK
jgi:hypothetical protein